MNYNTDILEVTEEKFGLVARHLNSKGSEYTCVSYHTEDTFYCSMTLRYGLPVETLSKILSKKTH